MRRLIILILLVVSALFNSDCLARKVSLVMGTDGNDFDPWDQVRWADWYDNGVLVEPFEIDLSIKFKSRTTPWEVDVSNLQALPAAHPAVLTLNTDASINIDGNGIAIDARKPYVQTWDLNYYYTHTINLDNDYYNCDGLLLLQSQPTLAGAAASTVSNITFAGFRRGVSASHFHQGEVVCDNLVLNRNVWGFFPRGANVTVQNSQFLENVMGGFYGEYNSRNWNFNNNTFKDNNNRGTNTYGDIVLDACRNYTIQNNSFLSATYNTRVYRVAISLFRNAGETGDIRELASQNHLIDNNTFDGYNIAIDFAPRMGLINTIEQSHEARCYATDNLVQNCTFNNCVIGILLRGSANKISGNVFNNVEREIALHNVFYAMHHNYINQPDSDVWLWSVESDYQNYSPYILYGNGVGSSISASEKFYHVVCDSGMSVFHNQSDAEFLVAPGLIVPDTCDINSDMLVDFDDLSFVLDDWLTYGSMILHSYQKTNVDSYGKVDLFDVAYCSSQWLCENARLDAYPSGGKPVDMAVGDFATYEPGDEIAVIWNRAVSKVEDTDYFNVIFYDQNGLELDRCARSTVRWSKIASGNFLPDTGYIKENSTHEIALAATLPDESGMYPIYIFRKGFKDPAVVLLENNASEIVDIAGGNFTTLSDEYDELAVKLKDSDRIIYIKPSDPSYVGYTFSVAANITAMAGGNYDGLVSNGDEVACITSDAGPVLMHRLGEIGSYAVTADCGKVWKQIAGGNFDGGLRPRDEIALIAEVPVQGVYEVEYFAPLSSSSFKEAKLDCLSISPVAIGSGEMIPDSNYSCYEKLINISENEYKENVGSWGDSLVLVPSQTHDYSYPAFWIGINPINSIEAYYKIVPLLK